jgi:hypothetical protein
MAFNVEVVLPSGRKVRVEELKNRDYLDIVKFCSNQDMVGLAKFFDDRFINSDLNIIERFYLLLYIRMLFIEPDITLNVDKRDIKIDIATMLNKIEQSYIDLERTVVEGGIEVTLDLPKVSYFETMDDLYLSTITSIKVGNEVIDFSTITEEECVEIIDNLPATIFKHFQTFIQTIQDNLLDVALIDENKQLGIEALEINIVSNGVMHFISMLYNTNLEGFYNLIYSFQNTILPGSNLFFDLSPIETQIILNAHQKRVAEENERLQKQQQ